MDSIRGMTGCRCVCIESFKGAKERLFMKKVEEKKGAHRKIPYNGIFKGGARVDHHEVKNEVRLLQTVKALNIWRKGDQRAPHKPLLLLYALGHLQQTGSHSIRYEEASVKLKELLMEFGPSRKSYHPEQPFVRLAYDGIWQVSQEVPKDKIRDNWLKAQSVTAGFTEDVLLLLKEKPALVREIAETLLEEHFSETLHQDILLAVGLDLESDAFGQKKYRKRDPHFRDRILSAYRYRCAVCGYDVRLKNQPVGLEAAHIKWHQAGGPDQENNGLALCALHHKLFDLGAFTLDQDQSIRVSLWANGSRGLEEWLLCFQGKSLLGPGRTTYFPEPQFVDWHVREVFKGAYSTSAQKM